MRKYPLFLLALIGSAASAHDLWLQPSDFEVATSAAVPFKIEVGHGKFRENWGIRGDRLIALKSIDPSGRIFDLMNLVRRDMAPPSIRLPLRGSGTHMVVMQSNNAVSELPAARFNDYLAQEGLTPAIAYRLKTGSSSKTGRELYSRRGKSLVQIGPANAATGKMATRRVGLDLEIVPEINPYLLRPGQYYTVKVYYQNRPLSGALVSLTNLDADEKPLSRRRTNTAGRVAFKFTGRGKWLLNVVWTQPDRRDPRAEFLTTFSSLTFG